MRRSSWLFSERHVWLHYLVVKLQDLTPSTSLNTLSATPSSVRLVLLATPLAPNPEPRSRLRKRRRTRPRTGAALGALGTLGTQGLTRCCIELLNSGNAHKKQDGFSLGLRLSFLCCLQLLHTATWTNAFQCFVGLALNFKVSRAWRRMTSICRSVSMCRIIRNRQQPPCAKLRQTLNPTLVHTEGLKPLVLQGTGKRAIPPSTGPGGADALHWPHACGSLRPLAGWPMCWILRVVRKPGGCEDTRQSARSGTTVRDDVRSLEDKPFLVTAKVHGAGQEGYGCDSHRPALTPLGEASDG